MHEVLNCTIQCATWNIEAWSCKKWHHPAFSLQFRMTARQKIAISFHFFVGRVFGNFEIYALTCIEEISTLSSHRHSMTFDQISYVKLAWWELKKKSKMKNSLTRENKSNAFLVRWKLDRSPQFRMCKKYCILRDFVFFFIHISCPMLMKSVAGQNDTYCNESDASIEKI